MDNPATDVQDRPPILDVECKTLCHDLGLPEAVRTRAWDNWKDWEKQDDSQINVAKKEWFAAFIYIAAVDSSMPYGPSDPHVDKQSCMCITVTDLLKTAHTNVFSFLEQLRTLRETARLSDAVKHHLTRLEKRYCIVYPLYDKFHREWKNVFREDDQQSGPIRTDVCLNPDSTAARKMLCWTLFLHAKDCLLQESQELIYAYHVLVCCIEYVVRTTPSFQLQEPFDMLRLKSTENLDQNGFNVAVLSKLAELFKTSLEELYTIQKNTESFFESLKSSGVDLVFPVLRDLYHESYRERGDLDEIQFLDNDPHLLPKGIVMPCQSSKDYLLTPVRTALNTIKRLKTILASSEDEPDLELKKYFRDCTQNPESSVVSRLSSLRCKFLEQYQNEQEGVPAQRYELSVKLYYRVMKQLLDMEKERLSVRDFSSLLNNDVFHRSLMACSIEIVLMTYSISWHPSRVTSVPEDSKYAFPWVLDVLNLHPYDFYKVIESFIQAEPNLTREIIQHLTAIENKILDSIAWKSDSPLLELLPKTDPSTIISPSKKLPASNGAELYVTAAGDQKASNGSPGSVEVIYCRDTRDGVTASFSKDTSEVKPGQKKSGPLLMFLNKVFRLGHQRLKALCGVLLIPDDLQHKIWTCFELCLTWRTDLMKNRHLDMIMMCCVYGICKVSEKEIKFKDIVTAYRTLPFSEAYVYKSALIQGNEYDSIISFYNKVFMQSMKNFILQFAKSTPQMNLSPVPRPVTSPLTASPVYCVPGRKNFYVSPLRESPFKAPQSPGNMTPRSRQLYSFGEGIGSAEKLKHINESLSAFKSKNIQRDTPRSLKRLSFDEPEEDDSQSSDGSTVVIKKKRLEEQGPSTTSQNDNTTDLNQT